MMDYRILNAALKLLKSLDDMSIPPENQPNKQNKKETLANNSSTQCSSSVFFYKTLTSHSLTVTLAIKKLINRLKKK